MAVRPLGSVSATPAARPLHPHKELLVAWTLLLLLDGEHAHGYKLREELLARGLDLDGTALYRLLRTFEQDRWVTSCWAAPVAGPQRHAYSLTAKGSETLHQMSGLIAATRETYDAFLGAHEHAVARRDNPPGALDDAPASAADDSDTDEPPASEPSTPLLRPHKELLVGWLLLRLDAGPTYGWNLRRHLAAQRLTIETPTVYRTLRKLERQEWLQSRWLSPSAGPRRRFYRLTTRGRRNLDEIAVLITAIRDLHGAYLREYEQARRRHGARRG